MTIHYKKCFTCRSLDVSKIIYGYPTPEVLQEQTEGKIKRGGCMISENSPTYHCNNCGMEWTADEAIDATYGEMIGLRVSVNRHFGGCYHVVIYFQDKRLIWKYGLYGDQVEKKLSDIDITKFINGLKTVDLLNWEEIYEEPNVLDGTQWEVEILREKGNLKRSGCNKFPTEWESFCELIRTISDFEFK